MCFNLISIVLYSSSNQIPIRQYITNKASLSSSMFSCTRDEALRNRLAYFFNGLALGWLSLEATHSDNLQYEIDNSKFGFGLKEPVGCFVLLFYYSQIFDLWVVENKTLPRTSAMRQFIENYSEKAPLYSYLQVNHVADLNVIDFSYDILIKSYYVRKVIYTSINSTYRYCSSYMYNILLLLKESIDQNVFLSVT